MPAPLFWGLCLVALSEGITSQPRPPPPKKKKKHNKRKRSKSKPRKKTKQDLSSKSLVSFGYLSLPSLIPVLLSFFPSSRFFLSGFHFHKQKLLSYGSLKLRAKDNETDAIKKNVLSLLLVFTIEKSMFSCISEGFVSCWLFFGSI